MNVRAGLQSLRKKISPVREFFHYYRVWIFGSFWTNIRPYFWDLSARSRYRLLDLEGVKKRRKSDRVFIFGSGSSIKRITDEEWAYFAGFDTFGFSYFGRNRKVRIDFHMIAEVMYIDEFLEIYRNHPCYAETLYVIQEGWHAAMGNRFVASGVIEKGKEIFRFKRTGRGQMTEGPSESIRRGVIHTANSITDMIGLAYLFGWKEIVLVGVDLVDKRYFYLGDQETNKMEAPGITYASAFPGGDIVLKLIQKWNPYLKKKGVTLSVYNPHSLLAAELPIFKAPLPARD